MKKYIALFMAILMLALVGCSKTPSNDTSTTDSVTTTEPETTTEKPEPLSYDEFFSEVRPYEIKETDFTEICYPDDWDKNLGISSNWWVAQVTNRYTDKWGSHTSEPYKYDGEFREDRLYLLNRKTKTVEGFFSDCNIYHNFDKDAEEYTEYLRPYLEEYAIRKEGVYAVVDHNELALLDYEGKKVKTIFSADSEIYDFYVLGSLAWVFSGGTIYRIYLPTGDADKIIDIVEPSKFIDFYYPISNFEIHWCGKDSDGEVASFYYNAKTGESKKRVSSFKGKNNVLNMLYQATGWWFVPEDSYKMLEKIKFELPEGFRLSSLNEYSIEDFRVTLNCGGSLKLYCPNTHHIDGFLTVNYDFKPVFRDGKLVGVENIPSWYKLGDFKPYDGKDDTVVAQGEYAPYYADKFYNYHFAFVCEGEDEPVYAVIIPTDACSAETFDNIVKTIEIEK